MSRPLGADERFLLERIRALEAEELAEGDWILSPGFTEYAAAAQLAWYLPPDPDWSPTPEDLEEGIVGPLPVPDLERVRPLLANLVRVGYLVELGQKRYPWLPGLEQATLTLYATPGFPQKRDALWLRRRYDAWAKAQRAAGLTPFEPRRG